MGRSGRPSQAAISRRQDSGRLAAAQCATADEKQCADQISDHVPRKSVSAALKVQQLAFANPLCALQRTNWAARGLLAGAADERGEVMPSEQEGCSLVHSCLV